MNNYSQAERAIFGHFDLDHLCSYESLNPHKVYERTVFVAFLSGEDSSYVDALRRCYRALQNGVIHRLTPEWDALILDLIGDI